MRIRSVEEDARPEDVVYTKGDALAHQLPVDRIPGTLTEGGIESGDEIAQLIRSLRLSISALVRPSAAPARSIAVVGIDAGREAAAIAANLGISYAQTGVTTVIVDSNVHDAMQHELLGVPPGAGLPSVLSGASDARAATDITSVRNLSLLSAGPADTRDSSLVDGERFHRRAMPLLDWHRRRRQHDKRPPGALRGHGRRGAGRPPQQDRNCKGRPHFATPCRYGDYAIRYHNSSLGSSKTANQSTQYSQEIGDDLIRMRPVKIIE
jgi:hypothetical protein